MNDKLLIRIVTLTALGSLAALGCKRENTATELDEPRTLEPNVPQAAGENVAVGTMANNQQAISQLASARCARELKCGNVGADQKYGTQQDCINKLSAEKYDDLNADECRGGIDQKELSECLAEIQNENCDNPLDTIGRLAACRESDLCKALPR